MILSACPSNKEISDENSHIQHNESQLILEINQDARGMWEVTGKTLFFRLYDDGIAEFEFPDDKKRKAGETSNAQEINTFKQVKLSEKKLQQFTALLNNSDLRETERVYQRNCCCTDAMLDYQINFREKNMLRTVSLANYCVLGELKDPSGRDIYGFPKIVSDLMILADDSRISYMNK